MSQSDHKPWPFSTSRSTGTENSSLLQALLATSCFDEISNIDDFTGIRDYVRNRGRVDDSGTTTIGLVFWVYPTGLHGPYHEKEDGQIQQHGILLTIEEGASVARVVETVRACMPSDTIVHVHIKSD